MKKLSFFLMAMLFSVMSFAAETVAYTLTTAKTGTGGNNSAYASAVDYTANGITWNVTGNSEMVPWRIGGKSITNVDRAVYTKTALAADVTKIEITHGTVNCTLNSCTLIVSDAANGAGETFAVTVAQNTTSTITLPEGDYSNKYYKLVYNVTVSGSSNKYVQLSEIKFYTEVQTSIEAPTFTPEEGKVAANNTFAEPFALTIASATEGATIKYTLDGTDPALETALTYEAPITISTMVKVRAIAVKGEESSVEATATYIVASTEEKPYTASEAITAQSLGLAASVYVTGTVKSIEEISTQYGNATYNITDGVKELKIYRGKNLENAKFTSEDQLLVGDVVVVKGDLTSYNGAAQLGQNNFLISRIPAVVNYTITVSANPAEAGTVTGGGEFEETDEITVKAVANEGYEFVNWTEGETVVSTEANYSFAVLADRNLVANFQKVVVLETIYFINSLKWEGTIYAYAWDGEIKNAEWPGVEATKEAQQTNGLDVYSYTAPQGTYTKIIFNNGTYQTADLDWVNGIYYYVEPTDVWTVAGKPIFGSEWNQTDTNNDMLPQTDGTYKWEKTELELAAGAKIEFKVVKNHAWDEAYPAQNYVLDITESGIYTITITFNAETKEVAAVATKTGSSEIVVTYEYVLMGVGNDWETGIALTQNLENTNEYVLLQQEILEGDAVKVVTLANGEKSHYCGNVELASVAHEFDKDGNIVLAPGKYDFYYKVAEDIIYIAGEAYPVEPEVITYELNGGEFPAVVVPTNAELWEAFKPYYNTYYGLTRADQPIDKVSTFASAYMQKIMTDEASEYKWLGDYVLSVATAAGVTLSTDMAAANESGWRWAVHAFFNAAAGQYGAAGIDFTEAGKQEVWGAAYEAEYGVVLPTEPVDAPYTLPTPVKEGYKFVGWYDNAEGTGEAYTVIPAGWAGTLYAIWEVEGPATALENIAVEGKAVKAIINGQLIIIKNGVQYNAQGAILK